MKRTSSTAPQAHPMHRRHFLRVAGASVAVTSAAVLAACDKDTLGDNQPPANLGVNLGAGDIGILNYAYALEQLEAAFYTQVILTPYAGIAPGELALLTDIRDHEITHREFFRLALGPNAIANLEPNFGAINFSDRASVLGAAKTFEDLGVQAYNGAGKLIADPAYLTLAGKIVSVEARHAAYIRELLSAGSFADSTILDANGLDMAKTPTQVLTAAAPFVKTRIDFSSLPQ